MNKKGFIITFLIFYILIFLSGRMLDSLLDISYTTTHGSSLWQPSTIFQLIFGIIGIPLAIILAKELHYIIT